MASGHDSSLSAEVSLEQAIISDSEHPLLGKLDYNASKSVFTWSGSFEELQSFCFKYLNIEPADCSITANERAKTIKTNSLILNFFKTRTVQVQGADCQNVKAQLQSILDATKANSVSDDEVCHPTANGIQLQNPCPDIERNDVSAREKSSGDKVVMLSDFKGEIGKIWSQITLIHEKLGFFEKPREAYLNNVQLINTLQQKNQNLCNEISMLKERLLEETRKLKKMSEERDSYKTALQVLTKELHIDEPVALSSNHDHGHGQADINSAEVATHPRPNVRQTGQKTPDITTHNRFEPVQDTDHDRTDPPAQNNADNSSSVRNREGEWNEVRNPSKPIQEIDTLIVGDSIIKDIKPSLMSASNTIRKQCLRGAKVAECTSKVDFNAYKCRNAVVIHLGTNNIMTDDSPKTIASKLAEVGKTIQRSTEAPRIIISGIISRQDTRVGSKIADTNCEIKSMCVKMKWKFVNNDRLNESCLNGSKLHLNSKGSAYLTTNFLKALNTSKQNIKETSWTKDNYQNFRKTKALLTSLVQGLL